MKKTFVFVAGFALLFPLFCLLCCDDPFAVFFGVVYLAALHLSPRLSLKVRKFWLNFYKVTMSINNKIG